MQPKAESCKTIMMSQLAELKYGGPWEYMEQFTATHDNSFDTTVMSEQRDLQDIEQSEKHDWALKNADAEG